MFYIFVLSPLLNELLGAHLLVKILLSILFIAPSAFFLGMPFPTGLSFVSQKRPQLIPWAWGVNGCLSVTGSVLARLASVSFGYRLVLFGAILLYLMAWWMFQSLVREDSPEKGPEGDEREAKGRGEQRDEEKDADSGVVLKEPEGLVP